MKTKSDVSVIIPTYNRCPFSGELEKYNPLWIVVDALQYQLYQPRQIIIVNDSSSDNTGNIVEKIEKEIPIDITYLENDERLGSPLARNEGVKRSKGNYIMFLDDDLIPHPKALETLVLTFNWLNEIGINVGGINFPVFHRSDKPREVKPMNEIAKIYFTEGIKTGNFTAFPEEYKNDDGRYRLGEILIPFPINDLNGYIGVKKDVIKKTGGFEPVPIENAWSEESILALKLQSKDYELFFQPDPKAGATHLKFGYYEENLNINDDIIIPPGYDKKRVLEISNVPRCNTGNRIDLLGDFESKIMGELHVFIVAKNLGLADNNSIENAVNEIYSKYILPENGINKLVKKNIWNKIINELT